MRNYYPNGVSPFAVTPRYPNSASDPRLINVNDQRKKLREIVTEKEWQGKNADAEKRQIKILSAALQEGKSYYPAF